MEFRSFMEEYHKKLTDLDNLEDLIFEASNNYRIQKLIVPYILKDKITFDYMVDISKGNAYAQKLLNDAKVTLFKLSIGDKYDNDEMKELIKELNNLTGCMDNLDLQSVDISSVDFIGYAKMFNNYLVQRRLNTIDNSLNEKVNNLMMNVSWDNLVAV